MLWSWGFYEVEVYFLSFDETEVYYEAEVSMKLSILSRFLWNWSILLNWSFHDVEVYFLGFYEIEIYYELEVSMKLNYTF